MAPSQNIPLRILTSTDESKLALPPDLKALSLSVSFHGWREANSSYKSWATKMSLLHRPTWKKAGILEAVMASTKGINKDTDLLLGIAERWCPDTNTFLFPWGEATITLEDVMVLLGFSVLGSPYFTPLDSSGEEILRKLEAERVKIKGQFVTKVQWMGRFMGTRGELEHVAFLVLWVSYFVFPTRYYHIDRGVLPIAVHLSRGNRIALAPPVLARLYADLSLLKYHIRGFTTVMINDKVELISLFKLVQVWTWERFRELRPNNTNPLRQGEPRLSLWDEPIQKRAKRPVRMRTKRDVRKILANSEMESFEWRPYTKAVRNWEFPKFYPEKAKSIPIGPDIDEEFISFARCIKVSELVGKDSVEHYFPNRVASQFGLLQDVPCPVKQNNLFKEAAWDEYNKPIEGLRLFVPCRSSVSSFTSVFCEWWRKGKRAVEVAESLGDDDTYDEPVPSGSKKSMKRVCKEDEMQMDRYKTQVPPRNIRRGDDDASELVPSGSKKRKSMKRVCKEDETQVASEKDEEDDSLSIDQAMRMRKKNTAIKTTPIEENHFLDPRPPKVLPLSEMVQKQRKEFLEKLKRSRDLRTPTNVRSKIMESGGSASREVPNNEDEVVKRKREHLGDKRARNITTAEMVIDREKGVRVASESLEKRISRRLERDNNDSWIRQKLSTKDETVAQREETGKNKVLSSAKGNNSSDLPLGANGGVVDIAVSRPKTRNCDDEVDVKGIKAEKKKTIVVGGTKEAKCVIHEDGENQRSNEREENHSLDPPPKVLPLSEVVQKQRKEFLEKLLRSRYLRTPTDVRSEIADSGGSLNELFQKEVVKRKSEPLGDKRPRNSTTAEMVIDREKSARDVSESLGKRNSRRLESDNNDSWIRQKIAYEDETVAQREETGNKAGKNKVLSSDNGNNSSDPPPLGAYGGVADTVLSRPKTMQNCDDEVDVDGIKAEKNKSVIAGGSKEAKCVIHEDGENQRSNEKEDDGKSLRQTKLAIDELALSLEARMMMVEKTLAKISEWKTIERNQAEDGITA